MEEEWRKFRDSEYEVSNLGRIRNTKTGNILKAHKKNNGKKENDYLRIRIKCDGVKKTRPLHRLVAECFLENYSDKLEVNHINGVKYDNRLENLEMTTKEQNYQHSVRFGSGAARKPVFYIDEDGEKEHFTSLWSAARFIKEKCNKEAEIDKICTNIKRSIFGKSKNAYGYRWFWESNT